MSEQSAENDAQDCETTYRVDRVIEGEWHTVSLNFETSGKARDYARNLIARYPEVALRIVREHVCRTRTVLDQTRVTPPAETP